MRAGQEKGERASLPGTKQAEYSFVWQGGEPTFLGAGFFRRVIELQKIHGRKGARVANALQTNGTMISPELADLFGEYRFLLGVSLDGPKTVHDTYRVFQDGRGSHASVQRGIECLRESRVPFNVLTLVTDANVHRAGEVYRYHRDQGFAFQQYLPCVEADEAGRPFPYAIGGEQWGGFLCELFDEWYGGDTRRVSIRLFDAILTRLVTGGCESCHMDGDCRQYLVVEYNGDIYPCDFFVEAKLKIGNVLTKPWDAVLSSPVYREFGARKSQWNQACDGCPYLRLCAGDCLKHRMCWEKKGPGSLSTLCAGWRRFFSYSLPRFLLLAEQVRKERGIPRPPGESGCEPGLSGRTG